MLSFAFLIHSVALSIASRSSSYDDASSMHLIFISVTKCRVFRVASGNNKPPLLPCLCLQPLIRQCKRNSKRSAPVVHCLGNVVHMLFKGKGSAQRDSQELRVWFLRKLLPIKGDPGHALVVS